MSNDPKTALITGGAQRIGQALVNHFHDLGWRVIIHYHTSSDAADQLTQRLNGKRQDSARAFSADLGTIDQIEALAKAVTDLEWPLDLVIHNAAQFSPTPLSTTTESSWEHLMSTNLKAPFFLTQALLNVLSARANLIFLCDIFGDRPLPNYSVYSATKAGLAMMTRSLALDLAPAHRVNGIALGAILPPSIAASAEDDGPQDALNPAQRSRNLHSLIRFWLACRLQPSVARSTSPKSRSFLRALTTLLGRSSQWMVDAG